MSGRTQWVFRQSCGCPLGVLEGDCADSPEQAWRGYTTGSAERRTLRNRGVTVEHMSHARYVADVYPQMLGSYQCPHEVTR